MILRDPESSQKLIDTSDIYSHARQPLNDELVPHLVVHQGGEGQVVEQVGEVLPHVGIAVLPQTLVVEAVHLSDLTRLVVPPQDRDALTVPHLGSRPNPVTQVEKYPSLSM